VVVHVCDVHICSDDFYSGVGEAVACWSVLFLLEGGFGFGYVFGIAGVLCVL
jgi:hypothetical protein